MQISKLKSSDFTVHTEEFFHFYHERSDSKEGENVKRNTYTSKCKLLNRSVKLIFVIDNPPGDLDIYLDQIKANLQWVEDNKAVIYSTMTLKRSEHWFDSNATKNMANEKFISFLSLELVQMFGGSANNLSLELIFNELDSCPGTHFTFDIDANKKYLSAYHRGISIS